ncbi:MAG: DUF4258 domain-containing protein [Bacteroidota bacterium]
MSFVFRVHAVQRMFERQITENEVKEVIQTGKIIARYPEDKPFPSKLVLGWIKNRPIHIVVAESVSTNDVIVITVYEPTLDKWEENFEARRKK